MDDAARKAEILACERWRRAVLEMNEWLSSQQIYTPEEVAKIKSDFSARVHVMTSSQLEDMLERMDAKIRVLNSPEAQEARAWLGHYLSIVSDRRRQELLSRLPNFETMTAAQLQQVIGQIDEGRAARRQQEQQVQQLRDTAQNPWTQTTRVAEQAYVRDHSRRVGGYSSPYRTGPIPRPFEGVQTGPTTSFFVNPYGGVGLIFNSGW